MVAGAVPSQMVWSADMTLLVIAGWQIRVTLLLVD
jgi:hypothetical protein